MHLAFLGDIALFGRVANKDYFTEIADVLHNFDYVVGNLESPFSARQIPFGAKSAYLCASPESVDILSFLGVDAVTLANNHMYDYGEEGLSLTRRLLEEAKIAYFGVDGKTLDITLAGNKLSFAGYCSWSTNPQGCVEYGKVGVNELSLLNVERLMDEKLAKGFLPIFAVHEGTEHVNYPSRETIKLARLLARKGNYIFYGHHPHVMQGIEAINGSLIAYSLGNFCFDDVYTSVSDEPLVKLSANNRRSIILDVEIEDNQVKTWRAIPISIGEKRLTVGGEDIVGMLNEYSTALEKSDETVYVERRDAAIHRYYGKRKEARNLSWVVKRLRPRYAKLLISNRLNANRYQNKVIKYLDKR